MSIVHIQSGAGKGRDPLQIRKAMAEAVIEIDGKRRVGVSCRMVAKLAKTNPNVVTDTIKGIANHARTLDVLENTIKIPRELLYPIEAQRRGKEAA